MTGRTKHRDSFQHGDTIDLIELISRITLIDVISEITEIRMIESITSLPDITPRGSDGASFRQVEAVTGAWVSPNGTEDPDGTWTDDAKVYDEDTDSYAYTEVESGEWGSYLFLTLPGSGIICNKIRFNAYSGDGGPGINFAEVSVEKDGVWTIVHLNPFEDHVWVEKAFSQGKVTRAKIMFHGAIIPIDTAKFYEFDFWQVDVTGGELITLAEGQYLATPPTLSDEDLHNLLLTSDGRLIVEDQHSDYDPFYAALPDGTPVDVWTPSSGKYLYITSIIVSAETAGDIELYRDTTLFMKIYIDDLTTIPIPFTGAMSFDPDEKLAAEFNKDKTTSTAHITVIGEEKTPT